MNFELDDINLSIKSIGKKYEKVKKIALNDPKLSHLMDSVNILLSSLKEKLNISEKDRTKIISEIITILHVFDALQQIEQRWCPFKHMKRLKYNRDYYIYNSHNTEEVQSAVGIIKQHGRLTSKNSSKKIPSNDMSYTEGSTVFSDFMEYAETILTT